MPRSPPRRQDEAAADAGTNEDGALDTPLHRLRGFGTGLHRKRIAFVKAGEKPSIAGAAAAPAGVSGAAVSDLYLSIVLGASAATDSRPQTAASTTPSASSPSTAPSPPSVSHVCTVCHLSLGSAPESVSTSASTSTSASVSASAPSPHPAAQHEACLVHQVALGHSKPPSALDRGRFGLAVMAAQGWDPDSGRGLGREQQGIPYPIEARVRPDRTALGSSAASTTASASTSASSSRKRQPTRKQLRTLEQDRKRRHDRLRDQIMGNRDLDRYLYP